ncbi:MAG: bifunctional diaminohydroxyphosphoribosylaminopyrimidine deaminase/5-amino-6-(5-phosphoribosylamino)uracil reductase RibD [Mariprofundaceae bacterium]|nr:bifunctional diaminohydroxyphosphoribosylaminopyrimidine deaminase/5-amino-6-(5-phosphoribosylamino)uracil reductase RibD [Mariprofundaceae bacterium]
MKTLTLDQSFMRRALLLARRGVGSTHPNPRVGAVVVLNGKIIGEGWHKSAGMPHAEPLALADAGERAKGATLYVTLEPCAAKGRTPACVDAVLAAGIARLVYASRDPNPRMAGGARLLRQAGLEVCGDVLADEAFILNRAFFHFVHHQRPWVMAKAAMSLDGKLATHQYHSQWITGEKARKKTHRLRAESDALIVGSGTLHHDNPSLTVRGTKKKGHALLRVIIADETPIFKEDYKICSGDFPSLILVSKHNHQTALWQAVSVDIVQCDSLILMLKALGERGCLQLMLEGGGRLFASFLESQLIDELVLFQAPLLIGGEAAPSLWHGLGVKDLGCCPELQEVSYRRMGKDMMIRGLLSYPS